jgi:hypothetical protein
MTVSFFLTFGVPGLLFTDELVQIRTQNYWKELKCDRNSCSGNNWNFLFNVNRRENSCKCGGGIYGRVSEANEKGGTPE